MSEEGQQRPEADADLDAVFKVTQEKFQEGQVAIRLARQRADDRSSIAKLIIWAFVCLVSVAVLSVIAGTYFLGWDELAEPAKFVMSVLGSILLPVVTLVIGYYFTNR